MEGWKIQSLEQLSEQVSYGHTASARNDGLGPKFLRITDIQDGQVDWEDVPTCRCEPDKQVKHKLQSGDIVFARTGATTGKSFLIDQCPESAVFASYLIRVRPNKNVVSNYLAHYFQSPSYWKQISKSASGSAQPGVNASKLKSLRIPLPPLPEQERIVAILDEAFAAIATANANAEKNLANARELFESELNRAFSWKVDGWSEKAFGDVCENLDSMRVPITKNKRKTGLIPYYGASGVVDHVADFIFDEDLLLVSEDGANLLARSYPIAFSISGKAWVNNHAHVVRFASRVYQTFVEHYLNSISLAPYVSGMAQPKLNQKALRSIPVPWHSNESCILEVVERIVLAESRTKELESVFQRKLSAFAELRQSILHKAFTGELTADAKAVSRTLLEAGL